MLLLKLGCLLYQCHPSFYLYWNFNVAVMCLQENYIENIWVFFFILTQHSWQTGIKVRPQQQIMHDFRANNSSSLVCFNVNWKVAIGWSFICLDWALMVTSVLLSVMMMQQPPPSPWPWANPPLCFPCLLLALPFSPCAFLYLGHLGL